MVFYTEHGRSLSPVQTTSEHNHRHRRSPLPKSPSKTGIMISSARFVVLPSLCIILSYAVIQGSQIVEPELPSPQFQCYFTSWSRYRDSWAYLPANVDPFLCTTIVYAFAQILDDRIAFYDWKDEENLNDLVDLRKLNKNLRIHLGVGGWTLSHQFKPMAATAEGRQTFINSTVDLLRLYDLDGVDIDWEYPEAEDLQTYTALLTEMRAAFDDDARKRGKRRLALTVDVGALLHDGYDVPRMDKLVDLVNIMAYDYHGSWEQKTGHNAPMFRRPSETDYQAKLNVEYSANLWAGAGIQKHKLAIGIPTYGRSWLLRDPSVNGFNSPTRSAGPKGPYSKELGSLAYFEICDRIKRKVYTAVRNPECQCSYAYGEDQWVSFDDPQSVALKASWVLRNGFGGILVWELGMDDWKGDCGGKPMSMLSAIYESFYNKAAPTMPPVTTPKPGSYVPTSTHRPTRQPAPVIMKNSKCDDVFCSYRPTGDYPTGPCDEAFCTCVGGFSYSRNCPPGIFYDPTNKVCSWPSSIPGCAAVAANRTTVVKMELTSCRDSGDCVCEPAFCRKHGLGDFALGPCQDGFCACAPGDIAHPKSCPSPLVFDPKLSVCNWKLSTSTC